MFSPCPLSPTLPRIETQGFYSDKYTTFESELLSINNMDHAHNSCIEPSSVFPSQIKELSKVKIRSQCSIDIDLLLYPETTDLFNTFGPVTDSWWRPFCITMHTVAALTMEVIIILCSPRWQINCGDGTNLEINFKTLFSSSLSGDCARPFAIMRHVYHMLFMEFYCPIIFYDMSGSFCNHNRKFWHLYLCNENCAILKGIEIPLIFEILISPLTNQKDQRPY